MFNTHKREANRLLQDFLARFPTSIEYSRNDPHNSAEWKSLTNAPIKTIFQTVLLGCVRPRVDYVNGAKSYVAKCVAYDLLDQPFSFSETQVIQLLSLIDGPDRPLFPCSRIKRLIERFIRHRGLTPSLRKALLRWRTNRYRDGVYKEDRPFLEKLDEWLGILSDDILQSGDAWSNAAITFINSRPDAQRNLWWALVRHANKARQTTPKEKWLAEAKELVHQIGVSCFVEKTSEWLALVGKPGRGPVLRSIFHPTDDRLLCEQNSDILRGLIWCQTISPEADSCRALCTLAIDSYRKIPGRGPLNIKIGNACLWALGNMPGLDGISQLAILKARVKFGTAQKLIDKAFSAAAQKAGIPRDEIEEMAVPTYGLDSVGRRQQIFGQHTARLIVSGADNAEILWTRPDGKPVKSAPAAVKQEYADDQKELAQARKDILKMLPAQRERIDSLFLSQKYWPYMIWRERYLDHPLIGVLARRLIWRFSKKAHAADGVYHDEAMLDVDACPIEWLDDNTRVELWHPIGRSTNEVLAWRRRLEALQIRQPFKQAHREIYLLTDAERTTRVYSNRFASHVLRQHQFNALCAARAWKNQLRLMVDAEYPPATRILPNWSLRAEFWVEGVGEEHGADTNEAGVYHRVGTDQVRFYSLDASQMKAHAAGGGYHARAEAPLPVPLEDIPPLVFSEIMRDVDLFVGVASVGNDPTWQDGGPNGRHQDYWRNYAFGDLGETAKTRREVLASLIPRLKISDRCTLGEKFLTVRGDIRTYKIHLGSANILMEPNDQYLCIVQGRSTADPSSATNVFLPFEGDQRLSVILSKALLLANDVSITDQSIINQIRR